ncbi:50S ribosomal protein L23 [bacterium]|nr:50S ribosomal protein L23 [bacterium]NBX98383.1 50S ribosomal protein L23 [bacterium]NDC93713.1 50S ribosomal protein L23 [bacterium]NDD82854.1 50S ribosomal protein L23 [bacterium]NDG28649.1 50S ribosomal protein L23 [bacterium]
MSKFTTIRPRVSEKAYAMSQTGVYVFIVPSNVNKLQIAEAVTVQFNVHVVSVNTINQKGKAVRFYRAGKFEDGTRSDMKKAYVRLVKGESIPIFAAAEEDKETKVVAKKASKKAEK